MKRWLAVVGVVALLAAGGIVYWRSLRDPLRGLPSPPPPSGATARLQQYQRSLEAFRRQWRSRHPASPADHLTIAVQYAYLGHLLAARAHLRTAVQADAALTDAWLELGGVALQLGLWEEAEEASRRLRELAPRQPEGHLLLADVRSGQGRRHEIGQVLQQAWETVAPSYRLLIALERGQRGDLEGAVQSFQSLMREEPQEPLAYIGSASLELGVGRTEQAEVLLRTALKLDPTNVRAHVLLGQIAARKGAQGAEPARRHFEQALQGDSHDLAAWEQLAQLALARNALRDAAVAYLALLFRDPDHLQARYGLAQVYRRLGHLESYERQIEWYRDLHRRASHRKALRAALDRPNAGSRAYLALSDFHRTQGHPAQALSLLSQGMVRFPGDPDLQAARQRFFQQINWPEAAAQDDKWTVSR